MRKIKGYTLILASAVLLSGCVKNDIKMTDEQVDRAAEYAAGILLKYDKNYESTLIAETMVPKESAEPVENDNSKSLETENVTQSASNSTSVEDENDQNEQLDTVNLSDAIGVKECRVNYLKFEILDSYEQGEAVYMKADKDKKLVVLEFKIKNNSNSDKKVNLLKKNISYTLTVDGGGEYKPELSILVNDLQFYNENIQKGKSKKAVLVFSISEKEVKETMKLLVTHDNKKSEVKIR